MEKLSFRLNALLKEVSSCLAVGGCPDCLAPTNPLVPAPPGQWNRRQSYPTDHNTIIMAIKGGQGAEKAKAILVTVPEVAKVDGDSREVYGPAKEKFLKRSALHPCLRSIEHNVQH